MKNVSFCEIVLRENGGQSNCKLRIGGIFKTSTQGSRLEGTLATVTVKGKILGEILMSKGCHISTCSVQAEAFKLWILVPFRLPLCIVLLFRHDKCTSFRMLFFRFTERDEAKPLPCRKTV